jgi:DNA-binding LacI/PurR family transcriptional regulator
VVQSFEDRRVDGIVVTASRVGALYGPLLERMQIPIVLINNQHPSHFAHSVRIENFEASRKAVGHLIAQGHRRIAYIGDRFGYSSDSERFSGYRAALDEADIPFRPELVAHGDGKAEGGIEGVGRLFELDPLPTADLLLQRRHRHRSVEGVAHARTQRARRCFAGGLRRPAAGPVRGAARSPPSISPNTTWAVPPWTCC